MIGFRALALLALIGMSVNVMAQTSRTEGRASGRIQGEETGRLEGRAGGRGGDTPILVGTQLVRILCEDDTRCVGVWFYLRLEQGSRNDRTDELLAAISTHTDDVFEFDLDTTGRQNGNYTLWARGCDERLNLTRPETIAEACSTVSKAVRIRN